MNKIIIIVNVAAFCVETGNYVQLICSMSCMDYHISCIDMVKLIYFCFETFLFFVSQDCSSVPIRSSARDMATILDTALLQALLLTRQSSAALELMNSHNYCDVKICEEVLQISNHYTALLDLYRNNGMHREALKLLHELVHGKQANEFGVEVTQNFNHETIIDYLKVSDYFIFRYCGIIFVRKLLKD